MRFMLTLYLYDLMAFIYDPFGIIDALIKLLKVDKGNSKNFQLKSNFLVSV